MADLTTTDIAKQALDGTLFDTWQFFLVWLLVTALGSALGVWLRERVRGDVSKEIWLAQESWKEKYRLYTLAISSAEEIAQVLWSIHSDARVLAQMGLEKPSTEADGVALFPEHQAFLDAEQRANEKLQSAEVGIELMLNRRAKDAYQLIRSANTRSAYAVNLSYFRRIEERCDAAAKAKVEFIEAAKNDLNI